MEREYLEGLKLDKDTIDKIMAEHDKTKLALKAAEDDRDGFKAQLDDVQAKLKAFDDVDIDSLKDEISRLQGDLSAKENAYKQQLAEKDFDALLQTEVLKTKGKSSKAIAALLDLEALKGSKNQKEDIKAAIEELRKSDAYLFDVTDTPARVSTGGTHGAPDGTTTDHFVAAAMKGAGLNAGKEG